MIWSCVPSTGQNVTAVGRGVLVEALDANRATNGYRHLVTMRTTGYPMHATTVMNARSKNQQLCESVKAHEAADISRSMLADLC